MHEGLQQFNQRSNFFIFEPSRIFVWLITTGHTSQKSIKKHTLFLPNQKTTWRHSSRSIYFSIFDCVVEKIYANFLFIFLNSQKKFIKEFENVRTVQSKKIQNQAFQSFQVKVWKSWLAKNLLKIKKGSKIFSKKKRNFFKTMNFWEMCMSTCKFFVLILDEFILFRNYGISVSLIFLFIL